MFKISKRVSLRKSRWDAKVMAEVLLKNLKRFEQN